MVKEQVLKLSAVITTRNEEANIAACIRSFDDFRDEVEVVVVDNFSSDSTRQIAESLGAKVFDKGPERCAQRNFG
jgi:glycosyltransferase involved in cell wall biosynthesis